MTKSIPFTILQKSKKSQVSEGIKDWKIMTHFHLMRIQKHKIWSIIVLNMVKYTIKSLLLIDFVPIFVTFNLSFRLNKFNKFNQLVCSWVRLFATVNLILRVSVLRKLKYDISEMLRSSWKKSLPEKYEVFWIEAFRFSCG